MHIFTNKKQLCLNVEIKEIAIQNRYTFIQQCKPTFITLT